MIDPFVWQADSSGPGGGEQGVPGDTLYEVHDSGDSGTDLHRAHLPVDRLPQVRHPEGFVLVLHGAERVGRAAGPVGLHGEYPRRPEHVRSREDSRSALALVVVIEHQGQQP